MTTIMDFKSNEKREREKKNYNKKYIIDRVNI